MKPQVISLNRVNQRVYVFRNPPTFSLEPQAQIILKIIQEKGAITRYALLSEMEKVIETDRTASAVLSFHQRMLVRCKLIEIMELPEYEARQREQGKLEPAVRIVPNRFGGFGIQFGNDEPLGNYATEADAERTMINSCLIEER